MNPRQSNLTLIREACIRANPEIEKCERNAYGDCVWSGNCGKPSHKRSIRLADVLLALYNADADYAVDTQGEFRKWGDTATNVFWNLRADNLESQSDETLQFIANVLV